VTRAIVFAYSEVGVRCLQVLLDAGVTIPRVFTHTDDPGETQWFGSVNALADAHHLPVSTPEDPNGEEWLALGRAARPDFLFSFYYRYMLAPAWLKTAPRGALNMHGSLLPKYRGRAPVHWAILKGESETGASLHYMVEKPDAGALVDQEAVAIGADETALDVSRHMAEAAAILLRRALPRLIAGTADARPLDLARGSYFGRRRPEDGRIDWRQGARQVHDLVRAVAPPFPGAFTDLNGCRLAVLETRVDDRPPRHPNAAPCLYAEAGAWYADCVDGRRLRITKLECNGQPVAPDAAPAVLSQQPVSLSDDSI
jgi:methionyl-tRNA formyltransferase